jgi:hypothetical protein
MSPLISLCWKKGTLLTRFTAGFVLEKVSSETFGDVPYDSVCCSTGFTNGGDLDDSRPGTERDVVSSFSGFIDVIAADDRL